MPNFDPRTLNETAFQALDTLRKEHERVKPNPKEAKKGLKDQKNQAQELYTYVSTWGLMRLKAEEKAISKDQEEKRKVVKSFFQCLETLSGHSNLAGEDDLKNLISINMNANLYLGLTGLSIELANEFGFWANAVYAEIKGTQGEED